MAVLVNHYTSPPHYIYYYIYVPCVFSVSLSSSSLYYYSTLLYYYYYYYYHYALFKLSTTSLLGLGFLLPPLLRLSRSRCGVRSGSILQFAGEKKKAYAFMEVGDVISY
ncbi:hypothetical protein LOK49_LG04G02214 [Camellia lanceoleosa]|uniref:Uncharacterized protein n=1 Tax=Camellia lanceoleosa TaxID=1840588 RepID=A0ACC0I071_9ERIC|nr:hypothetical protein LOK49_LG04G02214 [Camellia lanceoleosa]